MFLSPGDLPNPGIELGSPALQVNSLPIELPGKPQRAENLPAMQKTWVQSLGREDLLEMEMAIYSSILAWKMPWTEEPNSLQSMGSQRVGHD